MNRRGRPTGETASTLPVRLAAGELELGDITLKKPKLFLLAKVEHPGSVNAPSLHFLVRRLESTTFRGRVRERWTSVRSLTRVTRRDNYVEFRGSPGEGRYRLHVSGRQILPFTPIEFTPGTDDLSAEIQLGGSLRATVLMDSRIPAESVWVGLEHIRGQRPEGASSPFTIAGRGHSRRGNPEEFGYAWQALWPGVYRLLVRPLGTATPLRAIENIEIRSGKLGQDDRLERIDLRAAIRPITITILDPDGRPVASRGAPSLLIRRGGDAFAFAFDSPARDRDGRYLIAATGTPVRLVVCARKYRVLEIGGITKDTTVRLQPPYRARVTLEEGGPKLPSGKSLYLSMTLAGRPPSGVMFTRGSGPSRLDRVLNGRVRRVVVAHGVATLDVCQAGGYQPTATIRDATDRRFSRAIELSTSLRWIVRSTKEPQEFRLAIPQSVVDRALRR